MSPSKTTDTTAKAPSNSKERPKLTVAASAEPTATAVSPAADPAVLRKKELFERVAAASGAKKKDVKIVVEAMLDVLGTALSAGEELALPPLGKLKVNRQKDLANGEILILRLRRGGAGDATEKVAEDENEALEDDAE